MSFSISSPSLKSFMTMRTTFSIFSRIKRTQWRVFFSWNMRRGILQYIILSRCGKPHLRLQILVSQFRGVPTPTETSKNWWLGTRLLTSTLITLLFRTSVEILSRDRRYRSMRAFSSGSPRSAGCSASRIRSISHYPRVGSTSCL